MGSTALTTTTATQFTLSDGTGVNVTDVVEFGNELVLVTARSDDPTPIFTCARGYFNTTAEAFIAGQVGHVNPPYPRRKIAEAIRRSFPRLESMGVPLIKVVEKTRVSGYSYCEVPADCREVYRVLYWGTDGRLLPLDGWEFFDNLPTGSFSTGKAINLGRYIADTDEFLVQYRAAYRWSNYPTDPVGSSTIDIPEGAEDLPALYAAAWVMSSRELNRAEIDASEEWNQSAQQNTGQSGATVRARWQEFYRALDEARRLNQMPQDIHFRRRPRF